MLRRSPIRSRGFSKVDPERLRAQRAQARAANIDVLLCTTGREGVVMGGATSGKQVDKRKYIRSKALLAVVRTLPCQVTGRTDGVEAAHSNWPQHGKAGRIKADDNRIAALHRDLHREIDQGSHLSAEQRQALWWGAHIKTVRELLARGLWPAGVPVPQLEDFWK